MGIFQLELDSDSLYLEAKLFGFWIVFFSQSHPMWGGDKEYGKTTILVRSVYEEWLRSLKARQRIYTTLLDIELA